MDLSTNLSATFTTTSTQNLNTTDIIQFSGPGGFPTTTDQVINFNGTTGTTSTAPDPNFFTDQFATMSTNDIKTLSTDAFEISVLNTSSCTNFTRAATPCFCALAFD